MPMHRHLPTTAWLLGVAGLIPFVACALGAIGSFDAAQSARCLGGLIAYGAVILAFLGGVHWGFVLGAVAPEAFAVRAARERYRLVFGVLPSLAGWLALLLLLLLGQAELALATLIAGFVATTAAEAELRRRGLMPPGYMWLRWGLSIVVVLLLATVLTVRLVGGRIIF
jgi:hypothetical protein